MSAASLKLPARVLIVDDHLIIQEGLKALLDTHPAEVTVVGCASTSREAIAKAETLKPDIVLLDYFLGDDGDGVLLLKDILRVTKKARVLVFSLNRETDLAIRVLENGAYGYLMKVEGIQKLMTAVRTLCEGKRYASPEVLAQIIDLSTTTPAESAAKDVNAMIRSLTGRELQVFQLVGAGLPPRTIAARLFISTKTVASHRESLKNKLNCHTAQELEKVARAWVQQSLQPSSLPAVS